MSQLTLDQYLQKIEEERIPPEKWNLKPELIKKAFNNKEIDREFALYLLKTIYFSYDRAWKDIDLLQNIIDSISVISLKNEKLFLFLEEIIATEYWYHLRFQALKNLTSLDFKRAKSLFTYFHDERLDAFLKYALENYFHEDLKFLIKLVNDPVIEFFIVLKKYTKDLLRISLYKNMITIQTNYLIYFSSPPKIKRITLLEQINSDSLLKNKPKKSFRYLKRGDNGKFIHEIDPDARFPIFILYEELEEKYHVYHGIGSELMSILVLSLIEMFKMTPIEFNLMKTTTVYYLTFEIKKSNVYGVLRLLEYRIEREGDQNIKK